MSLIKQTTNRWRWIAGITACILVLLIANQLALQPVALNISIPDNTVRLGEKVDLRVEITNNSRRVLYINRHIYFSLFPRIENKLSSIALIGNSPSGQQPPVTCKQSTSFSPSDLYLLLPGESFVKIIDVADCYGFDEIGIYQFHLVYGNSYWPEGFDNVWIGVIESNTIEVEIIP